MKQPRWKLSAPRVEFKRGAFGRKCWLRHPPGGLYIWVGTAMVLLAVAARLMMVSAPDTPYGVAFVHFWRVFARRPLQLARLYEAYAAMASLARLEYPARPWPTTIQNGSGQPIPFTIEALLAERSARYANSRTVPASTIQALLTRWAGATIKEIVAGWQGAGFQLRLGKRIRLGPKKTRMQEVGSLGVACTWQLVQAQAVVCSSDDADAHQKQALSALKGTKLLSAELGPAGHLRLSWPTGSWLAIQPDKLLSSTDYHLEFGWDDDQLLLYYCFEGAFIAFEQPSYDEQDALAS